MRLRDLVPAHHRAGARALLTDLPYRLRDLPADLRQVFTGRPESRLPTPGLRMKVAANSSREQFLRIGERCASDLLAAYVREHGTGDAAGNWLDFGCGCGRVARHLIGSRRVGALTGIDVDWKLIAWASRNLPGTWLTTAPEPPLPLGTDAFDVVVSVSVFTHLEEAAQLRWIRELRRVLKPDGLLLVSTHPPAHGAHLPAPFAVDPRRVESEGFVHVPSHGPFNHQSSFQTVDYLRESWSAYFELVRHVPHGLAGYQDLSVWRPAVPRG